MLISLETMTAQAGKALDSLLSQPEVHQLSKAMDLKPSAIGIKVGHTTYELFSAVSQCFEQGDKLFCGGVGARNIATIYKRRPFSDSRFTYVKLMQIRPASTDKTGLDHVDVAVPLGTNLRHLAAALSQAGISCQMQSNDSHEWLSVAAVPHHPLEFKFVDQEVWAVCCAQMQAVLG